MYGQDIGKILRERIELSSVIEKKIKIINKGHTKVALCPFHSEKTPSFHINDSKGFYHCFGCGAHGDVVTFVMQTEHLSFIEAVERLAQDYGIELPQKIKWTPDAEREKNEIKDIYRVNEIVCDYFQKNLFAKNGLNCLQYYYKRGLNQEQIKLFRLGYSNNSYDDLIKYLKVNEIDDELMLKAGVVAVGERGNYDKFRNRAMIPVLDKQGKVIAFTGRVLDKDAMPKYMNSPETPIYHKSHVLFNYFFARDGIYKNKKAIMVEGNFDALSLFINGIENVVAPMGTAATVEQFLELWRSTDEIVVCFDGDIAGKKAGRRVADMLLSVITPIKTVKFALLPDNIDPDDFIRKYGKDAFEKLISSKESCYSLSEFLFRDRINLLNIDLKNNLITPEEKGRLQVEFDNIVKNISNQAVAKNFNFFFRGELFKITKFDGKKRVENYKDVTKINYRKYIGSSVHTAEGLMEGILSIENDIFLLLIGNLEMVGLLYKNYNIDLFSINFYGENSKILLNIIFDVCEQDKIADKKYLQACLEKNNLNYYILGGDSRFNGKFSNILSDEDNKIKYLYWLLLEKNIEQLHLEEKKLLKGENGVKKVKDIELELDNLHKKKLQLEESFNF
jgi:DNA primase